MRETAWLGLERGRWMLLTGDERDAVRVWADRDDAIRQLRDEGWNVRGPFPELESGGHPKTRFRGYALRRILH